jgi:hypothetical protein
MPSERIGGLRRAAGSWLARSPEERVGFWLCLAMLRRDPDLLMRCGLSFALVLAAVLLGLLTDQFANPCTTREPALIALPVLSVYLVALAVPALLHNLTFCRDHAGSWLWPTAPMEQPEGLAHGAGKACFLWVVTPCCLLLGAVAGLRWGGPLSACLHAGLAWLLARLSALASFWLIVPALPFSLPPQRGGALGLPPLPLLALSSVAAMLGALHVLFADRPAFWIALALAAVVAAPWLRRQADRRLAQLARPS